MGGYATTSGPAVSAVPVSAANAPIVATPHVALPGSGPAPGAPISNDNDSRGSFGPSVANPNAVVPTLAENAASSFAAITNAQGANAPGSPESNAESFEFGVQKFGSSSPNSGSRVTSLGEIARYYRAHHPQAVRTFNNDSIARLTTTGLPFEASSNVTVASNASSANGTTAQPATLMAQNQPPALPQSDQDSLPGKTGTQTSATAAQQRHVPAQSPSASEAHPPAVTNTNPEATSGTAQSKKTASLPQTGSSLPLLLLLGGAGLAGGTLWLLRR